MVGPRNQPASSLNEGQARYILIDPALRDAGWKLEDRTQVGFEIPVDGYDATPWNGVTDYCLYAPGGEVLTVVEAKRFIQRTHAIWALYVGQRMADSARYFRA
jgi:type I site-specific restriction endonuclease